MKKIKISDKRWSLSALLCLLTAAPAFSGDEGSKPYAPTRLEWLATMIMPACNIPALPEGMMIGVTPVVRTVEGQGEKAEQKENTLFVIGHRDVPADDFEKGEHQATKRALRLELAKARLDRCKETVEDMAKSKGWSWLKVEVRKVGMGWGK